MSRKMTSAKTFKITPKGAIDVTLIVSVTISQNGMGLGQILRTARKKEGNIVSY